MNINQDVKEKVEHYILMSDQYSFTDLVRQHGWTEGMLERGTDLVIQCPFHIDESPSCSLNDKIGRYHCFSCGAHGNYINFLVDYDLKVNGRNTNYYQKLQELLRNDPIMQAAVGATSNLINTKDLSLATTRHRYNLRRGEGFPDTYTELAAMLKEEKRSEEELIMFILLMQSDMSPAEIYRSLNDNTSIRKQNKSYDLEEVLGWQQ